MTGGREAEGLGQEDIITGEEAHTEEVEEDFQSPTEEEEEISEALVVTEEETITHLVEVGAEAVPGQGAGLMMMGTW